jgi:glucose uptake protein GlcU
MKENHLYYWSCLAVSSIVSLSSLLSVLKDPAEWERDEKWVVGAAIVSLLLSGFGYFAHVLINKKFAGTRFEGLLVRSFFLVLLYHERSLRVNSGTDPFLLHLK